MISYQTYGDQAILINFEQKIDPQINAAVHALHSKIKAASWNEITFCIPAYCSLTVGYHPKLTTYLDILKKIKTIVDQSTVIKEKQPASILKIPVCYEEEFAPDLHEVALSKGLVVSELIAMHTSTTYDVYMLGFLPGFVYMGKLPAALEVQRKANPRLRVPAGSVGLAGFQTGIYPSEAPGGWQIIGQTPLTIFDPNSAEPFLFKAGDKVQFEAIDKLTFERKKKEEDKFFKFDSVTSLSKSVHKIHFLKAGLQTTIQDFGRKNFLSYGVPKSGVMDKQSAQIANELVGNPIEYPVLEMTLIGTKMKFEQKCQIAITGADLSPKINQCPIPLYETINVKNGDILSFSSAKNGCRTYLAIGGQWQIPKVLNSYSALPYAGQSATPDSLIKKNTELVIQAKSFISKKIYPLKNRPTFPNSLRVRVLAGPEFEYFSNYSIAFFFSRAYKITADSNRMGYRLDANIIDFKPQREVISSGIVPGTIQVTSAGQPVILMADAQTTGGYYRLANVVSADMDALGQLKPGDEVWFSLVHHSNFT